MINKINPLYILAFLITILLISFIQLQDTKNTLQRSTIQFNHFKENINKYIDLKKVWEDKNIKRKIQSIKKLNKEIELKKYKTKTVITLRSDDHFLKQRLINKVLNENFKVKKLDIRKNIIVFEIGNK